ncbi:MAG: DUF1214 domain-containing protein [Terriglobales bacterium]
MKPAEAKTSGSYIQKDAPSADKKANWLPAPNGPIYLVMRLYWPREPPSILPPAKVRGNLRRLKWRGSTLKQNEPLCGAAPFF